MRLDMAEWFQPFGALVISFDTFYIISPFRLQWVQAIQVLYSVVMLDFETTQQFRATTWLHLVAQFSSDCKLLQAPQSGAWDGDSLAMVSCASMNLFRTVTHSAHGSKNASASRGCFQTFGRQVLLLRHINYEIPCGYIISLIWHHFIWLRHSSFLHKLWKTGGEATVFRSCRGVCPLSKRSCSWMLRKNVLDLSAWHRLDSESDATHIPRCFGIGIGFLPSTAWISLSAALLRIVIRKQIRKELQDQMDQFVLFCFHFFNSFGFLWLF